MFQNFDDQDRVKVTVGECGPGDIVNDVRIACRVYVSADNGKADFLGVFFNKSLYVSAGAHVQNTCICVDKHQAADDEFI